MEENKETIETVITETPEPPKKRKKGFPVIKILIVVTFIALAAKFTIDYYNMISIYNYMLATGLQSQTESEYSKIEEMISLYNTNYINDLGDKEKHIDEMINAYQESIGDKYSQYITKEEIIMSERNFTGKYYGIGITMEEPEGKDYVEIVAVEPGSPAEKANVKVGYLLYKINGVRTRTDEFGEELKQIASGNRETITLDTDNGEFKANPTEIDLHTVSRIPTEGEFATIRITSFSDNTHTEFFKVYDEVVKDKSVKGLIIDLRYNGGGNKAVVTSIADRLAPAGLLYKETYRQQSFDTMSDAEHTTLPIVILVNEYSASASELLTMVLQDTNGAFVIGTQTYGKSTIAEYHEFDDGSVMLYSIGHYYPPSGRFIEGVGITPDLIVEEDGEIEKMAKEKITEMINE